MKRSLGALFLGLCASLAVAQDNATPLADGDEQNRLYLEALQALGEGRKLDASKRLKHLTEIEPKHAGAWLDLALIQCELGNSKEAEQLFADILRRFNPPQAIREIIASRQKQGCELKERNWSWGASLARGREQNVNQGASDAYLDGGAVSEEFLPKADNYLQASAEAQLEVSGNGANLIMQWSARRHDRLHQYDSGQLFAGVEQAWRLHGWNLRGSLWFGVHGLGGALYQRQTQVQLRATPPLNLPPEWQAHLSASASHLRYLTLTSFDANTQELRAQLQYRKPQRTLQASLTWANDHATDARPGGHRHGWLGHLQWREKVHENLSAELSWSRQTWRGSSPYSQEIFGDLVRQQSMQTLRMAMVWQQNDKQSWQMEWRAVRNRENISVFQYNNQQLQLSWHWYHN
ncbi:tetratricopeptide repeat protein [Massilia sp. W12]|uniref:tetratricopeptide repeat protein n=1 Tax=Massilia sp. W12 TaxID=3126507 RepID=UPI0030CD2603